MIFPFSEYIALGIVKSVIKTEYFYVAYSNMAMSNMRDFSDFKGYYGCIF